MFVILDYELEALSAYYLEQALKCAVHSEYMDAEEHKQRRKQILVEIELRKVPAKQYKF